MKLDERQIELIQADIDGELAGPARAELSACLLANPEARALRDDLRTVCAALDAVQPEEAPAGLREHILAALPPCPLQAGTGASLWTRGGRNLLSSPTMLRYAAVFAGGLIVSALAFQFAAPGAGEVALDQLVGTMARAVPAFVDANSGAGFVDKAVVELPRLTGVVSLYGTPAVPIVGVSMLARADVQVIARLEDQEIRFGGFNVAAHEPDVRVGAFKHERHGATSEIAVLVVDTSTGSVLQSSTLKFDTSR